MVKHLFFFLHTISFLIGFVCVGFSLVLYYIKRNIAAKYYTICLMAVTFILLDQTVESYNLANDINVFLLTVILKLLSAIGCALLIYYLPVFLNNFLQRDMLPKIRKMFWVMANIPLVTLLFYFLLPYRFMVTLVDNLALLSAIVYTMKISINYIREEGETSKKRILKKIVILSLVFLPYMLLDMKIEFIPFINNYFPYGLFSVPLFYLVFNILVFYFGFQQYQNQSSEAVEIAIHANPSENVLKEDNLEKFCNTYKITKREKEIIELIQKGYSYNKISEELFISLPTTKSHIYKVYQKTKVSNKVELINLINNI